MIHKPLALGLRPRVSGFINRIQTSHLVYNYYLAAEIFYSSVFYLFDFFLIFVQSLSYGVDSNASGAAALMEMTRLFSRQVECVLLLGCIHCKSFSEHTQKVKYILHPFKTCIFLHIVCALIWFKGTQSRIPYTTPLTVY